MSGKSKRAKTKAKKKEQSKDRLLNLSLMVLLGPAVIASSIGTGYYYGVLLGIVLELWGMWETPEIHPYLKLIVNWKSRKQDVKVNDSPGSNVITVQDVKRDVIIQVPEKKPVQEDAGQPNIYLELKPGFMAQGNQTSESLVYLQASNRGTVPVFIPSLSSLQILLPDGKYWIPREDWTANRDFPLELGAGRGYSIWRDMRGFVASLKKNGYSGKLKLRVICMDEAGRIFTGNEILFDIDDWAKA